jgi:unsaturated rhamnogalacturonyl hydrolase
MKSSIIVTLASAALIGTSAATSLLAADAPPAAPNTNPPPAYVAPYEPPTPQSIQDVLQRVHAYLDRAMPTRVVDRNSGAEITDFSAPRADAVEDRGTPPLFNLLDYTTGVTHAGMLLAGAVTGDARYVAFTTRHMQFLHDRLPYFRAQAERFGPQATAFRTILETGSLDDSGAMCAALIKARRAKVGADLLPVIEHWIDYIHSKQFRLADGTLARQRPQVASVWTDDFYMSIPALAQMGALTGQRRYVDDAAKQVVQMSRQLFNWERGLYMHGRNMNQPDNPEFYWGRANGWAMMSIVELLEVLPQDHPSREEILKILRTHVKAVGTLQSGSGLWHQMLDKPDSYLETSASAMFVFAIARAINRGWISPVSYGSIAQAGWNGLTTRVNDQGQVDGTCVGTTFASDNVYYYHRPAHVYAPHGYGPVLLAGAEMVRLMQNPAFEVRLQWNTYHYVPKVPKP